MLRIEYDASDTGGSARWANASDQQMDLILAYAMGVLGRPDTTT